MSERRLEGPARRSMTSDCAAALRRVTAFQVVPAEVAALPTLDQQVVRRGRSARSHPRAATKECAVSSCHRYEAVIQPASPHPSSR